MTSTVDDAIALGERILSARVGSPVTLSHTERIASDSDAVLVRGVTSDSPFLPSRKVVVKVFPNRGEERDGLLLREIVGYQFVGSLSSAATFGPELIAYDLDERAFVLSDLGTTSTLQDVLNEGQHGAVTITALQELATLIGSLQVSTAGREEDFHALLHRAQTKIPGLSVPFSSQVLADTLRRVPKLLHDKLGIDLVESVQDHGRRSVKRAVQGSYRAFGAAELIPENILMSQRNIRLLDFAFCGYRDIGVDIAAVLLGFPSDLNGYELTREEIDAVTHTWVEQVDAMWPRMRRKQSSRKRILDGALTWAWLSVSWILGDEPNFEHAASKDKLDTDDIVRFLAIRNLERLGTLAEYWEDSELADHARTVSVALAAVA